MTDERAYSGRGNVGLDEATSERLLSRCPVVVRRRVQWGECDPAGVVYTPRFADYLVSAYFWFSRVVLAEALMLDDGSRLATPMKALSLEYHHVLRPDDMFDMTVKLNDVRTRTFDLAISAQSTDGVALFVGRMTPIIVDSNFRSVALPSSAREALLAYQRELKQLI